MTKLDQAIDELKKMQGEVLELDRQLKNKTNEYRAKTKETFGVTDGETINILQVVEMIKKVQSFEG